MGTSGQLVFENAAKDQGEEWEELGATVGEGEISSHG